MKKTLRERFTASRTFYLIFVSGAVLSCALAVSIVWRYNNEALLEFQRESTKIEAAASFDSLQLYIGDRRSSLELLARDPDFIGAAIGNDSARAKVQELVAGATFFSDGRRLALLSVTLEPVVDHRPGDELSPASDSVMFAQAAILTALGETTPQIATYVHDGRHYVAMALPIMRRTYVEGVLYGEFEYAKRFDALGAAQFVLLGSPLTSSAAEDMTRNPPENYMVLSAPVPGTSITHHYFRNVERLQEAKLLALLKTGAALALGLALAFAALCAIGRALMLNPYRALEASRASLSRSNEALEHVARHDALTGLPNRRYLDAFLDALAAPTQTPDRSEFAILHIDLDRFKQINDTLGHAAGDAMLAHAGAVLQRKTRANDFVARIGGDEFVMVIDGVTDRAAIERRAAEIVEIMRQPIDFDGDECRCGASVGVAMGARGVSDVKKVLINADIALYRAKEAGRNAYAFFTETDAIDVYEKKTLADQIQKALETGQFFPVYQPQIDGDTGRLVGVEALARWRHPERGVLDPGAFNGVAEETGALPDIDAMVMRKAVADRAAIAAAGLTPPRVSVNVSHRRLQDTKLVEEIANLGVGAGELSFELIESTSLDHTDAALAANLRRLREIGVDLELDNFGAGYSSITSLATLSPRALKIDPQFVAPAVASETSRKLLRAMIDIGHVLDVDVIAEGVETAAHIEVLSQLGCRYFQGPAISAPIELTALIEWMRARAPAQRAAS